MSASAQSDVEDPFATPKANLRDTVKWLAGVFAALAAVVIAGTPLSGLGALPWGGRFLVATLALFVAFLCICSALIITLRLLRSDLIYPSDLDSRVRLERRPDAREIQFLRENIARYQADLFHPDYPTMDALIKAIEEQRADYKQHPNDRTRQMISDLEGYRGRAVTYAAYLRFYDRLRRSVPWLVALGVIALLGLLVFGVVVKSKSAEDQKVIVINVDRTGGAFTDQLAPTKLPGLDSVRFTPGSARITDDGLAAVSRARDALREHATASLLLLAHTDTVASPKVNTSLARRRADAVRQVLVEAGGIAASRLFVAELPEADLPELTRQETANPRNRTVELQMFVAPQR